MHRTNLLIKDISLMWALQVLLSLWYFVRFRFHEQPWRKWVAKKCWMVRKIKKKCCSAKCNFYNVILYSFIRDLYEKCRIIFCAGLRIRIILMRTRSHLLTLMGIRIRILLLIKVMGICDHCSTDIPGFHFQHPRLHCEHGPPRLHFEPLKFMNFDFLRIQIRI